jgi:hypothetical protein
MVKIAIGGDVCATGINQQPFASGDTGQLFGALADRLRSADLTVVNLESPFYSEPSGILKSGPASIGSRAISRTAMPGRGRRGPTT